MLRYPPSVLAAAAVLVAEAAHDEPEAAAAVASALQVCRARLTWANVVVTLVESLCGWGYGEGLWEMSFAGQLAFSALVLGVYK